MVPKEIFNETVEQEGFATPYKKPRFLNCFICKIYAAHPQNGSLGIVCKNIALITI